MPTSQEESIVKKATPTPEALLAEYAAAQDDYLHNDNFPWQIGGILIAGAFVFWGLLLDKKPDSAAFGVGALLVTVLLSLWILYAHHFRQTYLCKLHRLREIEQQLGMESHIRWVEVLHSDQKPLYLTFGPSGHGMNLWIYAVTSLGAPLIGVFHVGLSFWWLVFSLLIVVGVVVSINKNERMIKSRLASIGNAR